MSTLKQEAVNRNVERLEASRQRARDRQAAIVKQQQNSKFAVYVKRCYALREAITMFAEHGSYSEEAHTLLDMLIEMEAAQKEHD